MKYALAMIVLAIQATPVSAKDKPLPEGIKVITETEAKDCKFVDVVSAMRFAALQSASKTNRMALIAALEKAIEAGGNAATILNTTVSNNQHQYTLTAYRCG